MPLYYRRHLGGSQALQLSHKANNLPYPLHLHPLILHLTLENGSIKLEHVTVTMIKHAVEMLQVYALAGVQFED